MSVLNRIRLNELSIGRVIEAIKRRMVGLPSAISWNLPTKIVIQNRDLIKNFNNKYENQRCFIIGNGPSLKGMDLSLIHKEHTFGLNRIYLLFDQIPVRPSFYVCINELVLDQFYHEIMQLSMLKFVNWTRYGLFPANDTGTIFIRQSLRLRDFFGTDPTRPLCGGGTVTFIALQLAFYMGFSEVILIGVDHNFIEKGTPNTTEIRKSEHDPDHFHPNYFPKGAKWQFPDLRRSELAYSLAKGTFEKAGKQVLDATIDGKCPVFDKVDFYSLF